LNNPVCITGYESAFQICQSKNSCVKMMKMKLVMGEENDGDGSLKVKRDIHAKKEERN